MSKKRLSVEEMEELLMKKAKMLLSDKYLAPCKEMCGEKKPCSKEFDERMNDFQPTLVRDEEHVKELLRRKKEKQERCRKAAGFIDEESEDENNFS